MFARICDICSKQVRMGKKDKGLIYTIEVTLTKGRHCIGHTETHLCMTCVNNFHPALKKEVDSTIED